MTIQMLFLVLNLLSESFVRSRGQEFRHGFLKVGFVQL